MSFEEHLTSLNQTYFFREFTFSNSKFDLAINENQTSEVEFADNTIWLDDKLVVFQLKERFSKDSSTEENERKWFENKVLKSGTKQIRDTVDYLQSQDHIPLVNHRGDEFELNNSAINSVSKLVVFKADSKLPKELSQKKFYASKSVGIIHLLNIEAYTEIIGSLITPTEFFDYLLHRENLIETWGDELNRLDEQFLIGHYICDGSVKNLPNKSHIEALVGLNKSIHESDITGIISIYLDRIIKSDNPRDYYKIVSLLAKLKRNELREFKTRYSLSLEKVKKDQFTTPYRFALTRLSCGFVFIPLEKKNIPNRQVAIMNLTQAHKYDLRLENCLGISFARHKEDQFDVEWCYIEHEWESDPEFEEILYQNFPFRKVSMKPSSTYLE